MPLASLAPPHERTSSTRRLAALLFTLCGATWLEGCASCGPESDPFDEAESSPARVEASTAHLEFDEIPEGARLELEGVVVGDFQGAEGLGGFFLDTSTSGAAAPGDQDEARPGRGWFVLEGDAPLVDVQVGDLVQVEGVAEKHQDRTRLRASALRHRGRAALPEPLPLDFGRRAAWPNLEGRRVAIPGDACITSLDEFARYGELVVSPAARLFAPTRGAGSTPAHAAQLEDAPRVSLVLDDGRSKSPRLPAPFDERHPLRAGDCAKGLTGILGFAFGKHRLYLTSPPAFTANNPRPAPPRWSGKRTIVALNARNYFVTLGQRGARTRAELERQRSKLVALLRELDADIVGLLELENSGALALDDLLVHWNASSRGARYARAPEPPSTGTDAIRSAFFYRPDMVRIPERSTWTDPDPVHRRPPLAQSFELDGERFAVVLVHQKSRSCSGAAGEELDRGEGCFAAERGRASEALVRFVERVRSEQGDPDALLLGDFNALPGEASLRSLARAGFIPELERRAPSAALYSYVFQGQAQLLDHAWSTPSFSSGVTAATLWHVNADEAPARDARGPRALFEPGPFRASDHDPVVVALELRDVAPRALDAWREALDAAWKKDVDADERARLLVPLARARELAPRGVASSAGESEARRARLGLALDELFRQLARAELRGLISHQEAAALRLRLATFRAQFG